MYDIFNDFVDFDRYPAGVQDFATIRRENMVYVDKTAYIYKLTRKSRSYFLSRPRRFGKSLLLSTMQAYFQGEKELFEGLAIAGLEQEWRKYPVIRISLSAFDDVTENSLYDVLRGEIASNANRLKVDISETNVAVQFKELIEKAHIIHHAPAVVLIDEYDKPLNETHNAEDEKHESNRSILRAFYSGIKDCAEHLRFAMITGVTKYSHVSVFSGLNNLTDLSLETWCNGICGISESEMKQYFLEDMEKFGKLHGISTDEVAAKFKLYYDGYRFARIGENIYNPYSVIRAFSSMEFGEYWFQTGTPRSIIQLLRAEDFNFNDLEGKTASASLLMGPPTTDGNPIGLLYQAGYLTIKDYLGDDIYRVGFPNKEVSSAFYDTLLSVLFPDSSGSGFSAAKVRAAANSGEPYNLVFQLQLGLTEYVRDQTKDIDTEALFNSMLYGLCKAIGLTTKAEYHTANGRIDFCIETKKYIYLMEFKVDGSARAAINQINKKGYADKFLGDPRTLFKIGLNFDRTKQQITKVLVYTGDDKLLKQ